MNILLYFIVRAFSELVCEKLGNGWRVAYIVSIKQPCATSETLRLIFGRRPSTSILVDADLN